MDVREKLVELLQDGNNPVWGWFPNNVTMVQLADYLIANGVTVQEQDGCEYCNDGSIIYNADEEFYISGNTLRVDIGCRSYGCASINFCPMCGRRLHLPKPTPSEANS